MTKRSESDRSSDYLNRESLGDEEFVNYVNAALTPGLSLMNARCILANRSHATVKFIFELDERFVNIAGVICGGYVANALDQTMSIAVSFLTQDIAPTLEMKVSFLSAARPGRIVATGKVLKVGKSIGFAEAVAHDDEGRLVATGSATVRRVAISRLANARAS